ESGWPAAARQLCAEPQDWFAAALRSTEPLISEDLRADPRFTLPPVLVDAGLISGLVATIGDDEEPFGVLTVGFTTRIRLTDADGDFIKSLTNLLAAALQRMRQTSRWQASERRLKRLVDRLPAGAVYVVDEELFINAAVEAITGFSRTELTHLGQWKSMVRDVDAVQLLPDPGLPLSSEGAVTRHRELLKRQDGAERLIEVVAFRSATDEVWLVHDITDAESRRQQALQAERLAVIGQMITGLAHEARNALQRMRASTETLELDLEDRPDVLPVLERLGAAQDDLKTLFDEVRNYAAPIVLAREAVDLRRLVEAAWDSLFEIHRRRRAHLQVDISDELAIGDLDPFRIEQVLRNLFENSLAACPDPVEVGVAATTATVDGEPAVELIVADNGPGMADEIRRRVFEPFFTTKAKGTGLGMAIAERILVAHGGRIEIGAPAHGAEFRILLPRVHHVSPAEDRYR
ncbi:MAG TPA: ATP-binding protein, partial [Planctomycetaceae bacterium]|nr:ATP-binding protein [Planctomycetaceae bacterium]